MIPKAGELSVTVDEGIATTSSPIAIQTRDCPLLRLTGWYMFILFTTYDIMNGQIKKFRKKRIAHETTRND